MNTRGAHTEDDAAIPAALRKPVLGALWKEAGAFVAFLLELFSPDHLRDTGINRERGAQLSIYLANIEAGIRRLILAAALVFTPPAPQPRAARTQPPRAKPVARKHRAGLCIIRLPSTESTPAIPSQLAAMRRPPAPKPYGHMPFPCDPLLSLPPRRKHSIGRIFAIPLRNPLDRWVRLSRRDPDWRPPEPSYRSPRPRIESDDETKRRRKRSEPQTSAGLPDSLWDWRRCHAAWNDPVPAPDFAARLEALSRAIANPQALITHTARRIHARREATLAHALPRTPNLRTPRRARDIDRYFYREDFAPRCHARIVDTS